MAAITWSDDDESASEEENEPQEVANLCLMANEKESEVSSPNSSQFTFNELQDAFDELIVEFKKMESKIVFLKRWFLH